MLITYSQLIKKFNINVTGILHVGAHECEELDDYLNNGQIIKNIFWVEAMNDKVEFCKNKFGPNLNIYQGVIDDVNDKTINFKITNNGQSSSILDLGTHKIHHKKVKVIQELKLNTIRLDKLIENNNIPIEKINFINLDIQGVELRALKSMEKYIDNIKYIYTEVNVEEVYKDCNLMKDLDEYLEKFGFKRVSHKLTDWGWGDAFYVKN